MPAEQSAFIEVQKGKRAWTKGNVVNQPRDYSSEKLPEIWGHPSKGLATEVEP